MKTAFPMAKDRQFRRGPQPFRQATLLETAVLLLFAACAGTVFRPGVCENARLCERGGEACMDNKNALRQQARAAREAWEERYLQRADSAIARRILEMEIWRAADTVFTYISIGREVDTRTLIEAALAQGKRVCAPRCIRKGRMEARRIRSIRELVPASFGLLEPPESVALVRPGEIDLILVPCLAADNAGYRLGYGGGYYDRFLAGAKGVSICLCRERALWESVPRDAHDARVDFVVTEAGTIAVEKEA